MKPLNYLRMPAKPTKKLKRTRGNLKENKKGSRRKYKIIQFTKKKGGYNNKNDVTVNNNKNNNNNNINNNNNNNSNFAINKNSETSSSIEKYQPSQNKTKNKTNLTPESFPEDSSFEPNLEEKLFKHQEFIRRAITKSCLERKRKGFVLAHEVGSGKTKTAIAVFSTMLREIRKLKNSEFPVANGVVILCPAKLKSVWKEEIKDYAENIFYGSGDGQNENGYFSPWSPGIFKTQSEATKLQEEKKIRILSHEEIQVEIDKKDMVSKVTKLSWISAATDILSEGNFKNKIIIIDEAHLLLDSLFHSTNNDVDDFGFDFNNLTSSKPLFLLFLANVVNRIILLTGTPFVRSILDLRLMYWTTTGIPLKNNGMEIDETEINSSVPLEKEQFLNKFTTKIRFNQGVQFVEQLLKSEGVVFGVANLATALAEEKPITKDLLIPIVLGFSSFLGKDLSKIGRSLTRLRSAQNVQRFLTKEETLQLAGLILRKVMEFSRKMVGSRNKERRNNQYQMEQMKLKQNYDQKLEQLKLQYQNGLEEIRYLLNPQEQIQLHNQLYQQWQQAVHGTTTEFERSMFILNNKQNQENNRNNGEKSSNAQKYGIHLMLFCLIYGMTLFVASLSSTFLNSRKLAGERELFLTRFPNIDKIVDSFRPIFHFTNFKKNNTNIFPVVLKRVRKLKFSRAQKTLWILFASNQLTAEMKYLLEIPEQCGDYSVLDGKESTYEKYGTIISDLGDFQINQVLQMRHHLPEINSNTNEIVERIETDSSNDSHGNEILNENDSNGIPTYPAGLWPKKFHQIYKEIERVENTDGKIARKRCVFYNTHESQSIRLLVFLMQKQRKTEEEFSNDNQKRHWQANEKDTIENFLKEPRPQQFPEHLISDNEILNIYSPSNTLEKALNKNKDSFLEYLSRQGFNVRQDDAFFFNEHKGLFFMINNFFNPEKELSKTSFDRYDAIDSPLLFCVSMIEKYNELKKFVVKNKDSKENSPKLFRRKMYKVDDQLGLHLVLKEWKKIIYTKMLEIICRSYGILYLGNISESKRILTLFGDNRNNPTYHKLVLHSKWKEGITIKETDQFHILEPIQVFSDYIQVLGRVARIGTHNSENKTVEIFQWVTTDDFLSYLLDDNSFNKLVMDTNLITENFRKTKGFTKTKFEVLYDFSVVPALKMANKSFKIIKNTIGDLIQENFSHEKVLQTGNTIKREIFQSAQHFGSFLSKYYSGSEREISSTAANTPDDIIFQRNMGLEFFFVQFQESMSNLDDPFNCSTET